MHRYRPLTAISYAIKLTLAILLVSVILFPQNAGALSLNLGSPLKQPNTDIANLQINIKSVSQNVKEQEAVVTKVVETQKQSESKLETLQQEVQQLQQQVAKVDGMFVHIDKYAWNSAGNSYAPGNCTWYVKSMRPDIANRWGNANMWYSNAAAQGWNVGSLPKKGAVATTTAGWAGHVAYVIGVSLDQQWVTIREMNYGRLYAMNERTVHYTEFKYIYELN